MLAHTGLPRDELSEKPAKHPEEGKQPKIVKFGGIAFAPTPASSPAVKPASPQPAAAATSDNGGWGAAFLAANKAKAEQAAAAAKAEIEGGSKQPETGAAVFSFGLPAASKAPSGETPTLKQKQPAPSEEAAAPKPLLAPLATPLFGFAAAGEPSGASQEAAKPFSSAAGVARTKADAAPQYAFGRAAARSSDVDRRVAAAVAGVSATGVASLVPKFKFGGKKSAGVDGAAAWAPMPVRGTSRSCCAHADLSWMAAGEPFLLLLKGLQAGQLLLLWRGTWLKNLWADLCSCCSAAGCPPTH